MTESTALDQWRPQLPPAPALVYVGLDGVTRFIDRGDADMLGSLRGLASIGRLEAAILRTLAQAVITDLDRLAVARETAEERLLQDAAKGTP